jgi:hypothetical protein
MTSLSRHVGIYRVRQGNGNARLRRTTAVPVEHGSGAVLALRVSGSKMDTQRCPPRRARRRRGQADGAVDAARQGCGRVIIAQWVAVGAEPAGDCFGKLIPLGGSTYRTKIGAGGTGVGHGLLLDGRLGAIWEAASGANRPEPVPTELKQSL